MEEVTTTENSNPNPLVSIIVITYNSSKYVLETLESAKAQTYQNIELIISDDGSQDNTITICKKWLEENKERFVSTEMVTVEVNTGIPANCNRGLYASKGEWVKLIAGDDILKENCIDRFILYCKQNPEAQFIASNMFELKGMKITNKLKIDPFLINRSAKGQLKMLCRFFYLIPGPAMFLSRNKLIELGAYDERFKLVEDLPFLFKALKSGEKFYHLDEELVVYRIHETSISKGKQDKLKETFKFFLEEDFFHFVRKNYFWLFRHYNLRNRLAENSKSGAIKIFLIFYIKASDFYYWYFTYHVKLKKRIRVSIV